MDASFDSEPLGSTRLIFKRGLRCSFLGRSVVVVVVVVVVDVVEDVVVVAVVGFDDNRRPKSPLSGAALVATA